MVRPLPPLRLANRPARRLFLQRHALSDAPRGTSVADLVRRIGFVQVDSIATVERDHRIM